jgi:putative hydrolase of HD superfamily
MTKQMNIVLRELEIKDLEDYLYWNHPSREFHKFNGPYYEEAVKKS